MIRDIGADGLSRYAEIPIAFEVKSIFRADPVDRGLGGASLREEELAAPYVKD